MSMCQPCDLEQSTPPTLGAAVVTTAFEGELGACVGDDVGIIVGVIVGALLGVCVGDDVGCFVVDMDAGLDRRHSSLSNHGANSHCLYRKKRFGTADLEHERQTPVSFNKVGKHDHLHILQK